MAEREVKNWVTINGKHVPIYAPTGTSKKSVADFNEDIKDRQLNAQVKTSDDLNGKGSSKIDKLLTETEKLRYTHEDLKKLFSRTQIFPIYNKSADLINKVDRQLKKMTPGSPEYVKLANERQRLVYQHNNLLEAHKDRIIKEVQGSQVFMNDDYYRRMGF